ncbi:hypothetical protein SBA3_2910027 [Candidatus Sulfopaludibacter sp. SbA3]|nr:hypothetical protein SBA3_2910027 [Candidatus Sulfopaludibacter sp. SbA3]
MKSNTVFVRHRLLNKHWSGECLDTQPHAKSAGFPTPPAPKSIPVSVSCTALAVKENL